MRHQEPHRGAKKSGPQAAAGLFGKISLFAGPAIILVGVLMVAGVFPATQQAPFVEFYEVADEGMSVLPSGLKDSTDMWAEPDTTDTSQVTCTARSDDYDLAPFRADEQVTAPAGPEQGATSWVLVATDIEVGQSLECSGGGMEHIGLAVGEADGPSVAQGIIAIVFGVLVSGLGWVARRGVAAVPPRTSE